MIVSYDQLSDHNVTFHHDAKAQPYPAVAVWFLHGLPFTVHRKPGETHQDFIVRVFSSIAEERGRVFRVKSLLDPQAPCDVYLGELEPASLEALKVKHMRNFILSCIHREIGAPASMKGSGTSRLRAVTLLAKVTGISTRQRKVVKTEHLPK